MFSPRSTPNSKRQLFGSPSSTQNTPSTPQTPRTPQSTETKKFKSSVKPSIVGALVMIGETQTGKNNNFFDMKVQVDTNKYTNLRVMLLGEVPNMEQFLNVPARFTISSKDTADMIFFTPKFGSTVERVEHPLSFVPAIPKTTPLEEIINEQDDLICMKGALFWTTPPDKNNKGTGFRNGIITDGTTSIRVTIWRIFASVTNGAIYTLSDMNTKLRKFLTAENTKETILMHVSSDEVILQPDLKPYLLTEDTNQIDNVKIINIKTKLLNMCNSDTCSEKLGKVDTEQAFVRCPNAECGSLMRTDEVVSEYSGELTILYQDRKLVLSLSHHLISSFGYGQDLRTLEIDLMSASDLTLIYNETTKNVVLLCPMETGEQPNELDDQSLAHLLNDNNERLDGTKGNSDGIVDEKDS